MAETITVQAGPAVEPGRVALWEVDPAHPGGEIYVAAPQKGEKAIAVKAGRTAEVERHLRSGELIESSRATAEDDDGDAREAASRRRASAQSGPLIEAPTGGPGR